MPAGISSRKRALTLLALLPILTLFAAHGQPAPWKDRIDRTFVFEISCREAGQLLRDGASDSLIRAMMHTPAGDFGVRWDRKPDRGHFILARIVRNTVECEYVQALPFDVFLYEEYGTLALQVTDRDGRLMSDAKVRIGRPQWLFDRRVPFDARSRTYRVREASQQRDRLLTVEADGFTAVFDLTKHLLHKSYGDGGWRPRKPEFYSYMITDKNKYKPGETVRFKSYALDGNRHPLERELEVWLDDGRRYRKVATIAPYNEGGYAGEITLHDSLELRLDRSYSLQLQLPKGRTVARTQFRYEDYVLYDYSMDVRLRQSSQYYPDGNVAEIRATDPNGMPLPDAMADVVVTRRHVGRSYVEVLTLPDTLMFERVALKNDGATEVAIPASLFGEADCSYSVQATVVTNDGQRLEARSFGEFYRRRQHVTATTHGDTIRFEYVEAGKPTPREAELFYDGAPTGRRVSLPYEERFDQRRKEYRVAVAGTDVNKHFPTDMFADLDLKGGFKGGAFDVDVVNPLKLEMSWYLYRGGKLIERGAGTEAAFHIARADMDKVHYVEILYTVGGVERSFTRTFEPQIDLLIVEADLPERVYPGQTIDATIRVRDYHGNPVAGTDLLAMAWNSQLNYYIPDLTYVGQSPTPRGPRDGYSMRRKGLTHTMPLDYDFWRERAGLDSAMYYGFAYPDGVLFRPERPTPDGITQFAPYVMKNGSAVDIYVIEDNGEPIYFSWAEHPRGYSFPVDAFRKHTVTLRLHDRALVLDSLTFASGMKTILSLDLDKLPRSVRTVALKHKDGDGHYVFNDVEGDRYRQLLARFPIRDRWTPEYFIWGDEVVLRTDPKSRLGFYRFNDRHHNDSLLVYHPLLNDKAWNGVLAGPVQQGRAIYGNSTMYWHEGGFRYQYDGYVVYKYPENVLPDSLRFTSKSHVATLGDFYLSPTVRARKIADIARRESYWQPDVIYIAQKGLNMRFRLPERRDSVGVSNIIFLDRRSDRVIYPDRNYRKDDNSRRFWEDFPSNPSNSERRNYSRIAAGLYDVVLLYNDASYRRRDSVEFRANAYTEVDMGVSGLRPADSMSARWLKIYSMPWAVDFNTYKSPAEAERAILLQRRANSRSGNMVTGFVIDSEGEPLPGATVQLKGTQYGTVSNKDGYFEIDIDAGHRTLVFSFIGMETRELTVGPRSMLRVVMEDSETMLEDVVVAGYMEVKSATFTGSATMISADELEFVDSQENMAFNANPSSVLTGIARLDAARAILSENIQIVGNDTNVDTNMEFVDFKENTAQFADERLYRELLALNGLRSNFSDVGFWQPALVTDKRGEARFSVTFPDNVTRWDAMVYAMNRRLQTGTLRDSIRSYKPLMAELRMPGFMVEGDTVRVAAGVRNYTADSLVKGRTTFALGADTVKREQITLAASHSERIEVVAPAADSLTATYMFTRNDGYNDGERRSIAVKPIGTEVATGTLGFLADSERVDIEAREGERVEIVVTGNQLDVYLDAANYLYGYEYACNEQLASKLIGLLSLRLYDTYREKKFTHDRDVNELIRRLLDNRNGDRLWSWWGRSDNTSHWMSAHILRALGMARKQGYTVDIDTQALATNYLDVAGRYRNRSLEDIEILHAMSELGIGQPFAKAVEYWEKEIRRMEREADEYARIRDRKRTQSWLHEKMLLWEIRQRQGLDFRADSVAKYLKKDVLGAVYCDDGIERAWYCDALSTTLTAYRIARRDPSLADRKEAQQMYILGTKQSGWNTYRSAGAVATVLPDLIGTATAKVPATLSVKGAEEATVTKFPYRTELGAGQRMTIEKRGGVPLIWSAWKSERRTEARTGEAFDIETRLSRDGRFQTGQVDTLVVTVRVKQHGAEHVMIEAPIPAGCDYASKPQTWRGPETHREYFRDRTVIFCERMPEGEYTFRIELLPRFGGCYAVNPAKAELMYFPVVSSNNALRRMEIE